MASNKYFNLYKQKQEQLLMQDLVEEAIKIHAIDVVYIPRNIEMVDSVLREDALSNFNDYYHIEAYIKDYDGFRGNGSILSKFGLEIQNEITFSISRKSFSKVFGLELTRPREGDLIFLPMSTAVGLFEIKFVNDESNFFNLGEFYAFDLRCQQYVFQDENVITGISDVDEKVVTGSEVFALSIVNPTALFLMNEMVYQGDTALSATARGRVVESISNTELKIKDLYGTFTPSAGILKGSISNSQATLSATIDTFDIREDYSSTNKTFNEIEFIDFTENNPFSEE